MSSKVNPMKVIVIEAHGQEYYDEHLSKVAEVAKEFSTHYTDKFFNPETVELVALGHDLVEDTSVTLQFIGDNFGSEVMDAIWRLTDCEGYSNRKERKKATYPKILESELATFIKLCDRLANIRRRGKVDMYRKEHPEFRQNLYVEGHFENLWEAIREELDRDD